VLDRAPRAQDKQMMIRQASSILKQAACDETACLDDKAASSRVERAIRLKEEGDTHAPFTWELSDAVFRYFGLRRTRNILPCKA
jgi:hypothetical protein